MKMINKGYRVIKNLPENSNIIDARKCWYVVARDYSTDELISDFEMIDSYYGTLRQVQRMINAESFVDWLGEDVFCNENGDVYYQLVNSVDDIK